MNQSDHGVRSDGRLCNCTCHRKDSRTLHSRPCCDKAWRTYDQHTWEYLYAVERQRIKDSK